MKEYGCCLKFRRGDNSTYTMEIDWTDVGSGGYILVSYAHSNTSLILKYMSTIF
jgi:hypothetical protein